jgi:hypothetical protein
MKGAHYHIKLYTPGTGDFGPQLLQKNALALHICFSKSNSEPQALLLFLNDTCIQQFTTLHVIFMTNPTEATDKVHSNSKNGVQINYEPIMLSKF